jgi:hypothetical protein
MHKLKGYKSLYNSTIQLIVEVVWCFWVCWGLGVYSLSLVLSSVINEIISSSCLFEKKKDLVW